MVVAAGENRADFGINFLERLKALFATHAADDRKVHDDGVVGPPDVQIAFVEGESVFAVFREIEFIVEAREHRGGEGRDFYIVVHEQHATRAETERRRATGLHFDGLLGFRQINGEGRAHADFGGQLELPAVFPDDGKDGGEAEARAVFFVVKNGSKIFSTCSGLMPLPLSRTANST